MYLGAGATGAGIAHFPEIIFLIAQQYAVLCHMLFPEVVGFFILGQVFSSITLENGYVQLVLGYAIYRSQQLPAPRNGFFFKIIAKLQLPSISNIVW